MLVPFFRPLPSSSFREQIFATVQSIVKPKAFPPGSFSSSLVCVVFIFAAESARCSHRVHGSRSSVVSWLWIVNNERPARFAVCRGHRRPVRLRERARAPPRTRLCRPYKCVMRNLVCRTRAEKTPNRETGTVILRRDIDFSRLLAFDPSRGYLESH